MTQYRNNALNIALSDHGLKAYAWLQQVRKLKLDIYHLKETIDNINFRMVSSPSSSDFSGVKVQVSQPQEAQFEQLAILKDQMERTYQEQSEHFERLKEQAEQTIKKCTFDSQRRLLLWYFLEGFTWSMVAEGINRTERSVYRIRNEALEKIVLPDDAIWLE